MTLTYKDGIAKIGDQILIVRSLEKGKVIFDIVPNSKVKTPEQQRLLDEGACELEHFWDDKDIDQLVANHDPEQKDFRSIIRMLEAA